MCPNMPRVLAPIPQTCSQRGFALIGALVLVVVLAGLAAYAVSISSTHQIGGALDIQGSRALQAARSGMDWGIARVVSAPTAFGSGGNCRSGAASVNLSTSAGGDLPGHSGFVVSVACAATPYTDGAPAPAPNLISYALTATACNEPGAGGVCPNTAVTGPDYVERRVTTQVMCNADNTC